MNDQPEPPVFLSSNGDVTLRRFEEAYSALGIQKGDALFLHTRLFAFGEFNRASGIKRTQLLDGIVSGLERAVGEHGALMMTTLTLQVLESKKFDTDNTTSEGGVITEFFRKMPGVKRSAHPTHSFAVKEATDNFIQVGQSTFGTDSIYGKLYQQNATILLWGIDLYYCSFPHFIEESAQVPYRKKEFVSVEVTSNEKTEIVEVEKYSKSDRYRIDFSKFEELLIDKGVMKIVDVGDNHIYAMKAKDMYDVGMEALKKDPYFFLRVEPFGSYYLRKFKELVKKALSR